MVPLSLFRRTFCANIQGGSIIPVSFLQENSTISGIFGDDGNIGDILFKGSEHKIRRERYQCGVQWGF
jgi:hypothetical protein